MTQISTAPTTANQAETPEPSETVPMRRAPRMFLQLITALHRLIPKPLGKRVPVTFIGYAIINGSGFLLDISLLWLFNSVFGWYYPLSITLGYALAGLYSLILNRWLNFQAHGHAAAQGARYVFGLISQYVIFILGLSSVLHYGLHINPEVARVISACCEGISLYVLMRIWVFKGVAEPKL